MATTFHGFHDLPAELRLQIWEGCIRPDGQDVHFFTIETCFDPSPEQSGISCELKPQHYSIDGEEYETEHVAAPLFGAGSQRSWTENNPSTYLIDVGLWTACRESREESLKREPYCRGLRFSERDYKGAPGTGRFRHNGEDWCFAVFSHRDLFCVQHSGKYPSICFPPAPWLFAGFGDCTFASARLGFNGVQSLAFEYDASWSFSSEGKDDEIINEMAGENNARGLFLTTLEDILEGGSRPDLYLIDRDIRLKPDARGWKTFHGNGCKYIDPMDEDIESYGDGDDMGASGFIYAIESLGYDYYTRVNDASVMTTGSEFDYIEVSRYINVLAVQKV
ncbi:hypothetical protein CMUS01_08622 [Colletotrichum musicola]|uniref:2EXR domain-containing protein n=1 Tax=Colletotrichum musicola TaxID=2175873 RepID=A0A8H6NCD4_9PEZI|nr:hypothetical protein CMUS01_08622 [Colletotrichum musicola]